MKADGKGLLEMLIVAQVTDSLVDDDKALKIAGWNESWVLTCGAEV